MRLVINRLYLISLLCCAAALPAAAAPRGRVLAAEIKPPVLQAGAQFSVRFSAQNTGSAAWQTYGLRLRLYDARRRLVKFPAGAEPAYSVTAPWAAGAAVSAEVPVAVPGLGEFISGSLASGDYFYLAELYASETACTAAELFRKSPVAKGQLRELRIFNPSAHKRNAAVTGILVSSAAAAVTLRNHSAANIAGATLRLYRGADLLGERAIDLLPAGQEVTESFAAPFEPGRKASLRAVLVAEDDFKPDNFLETEAAP